MHVTKTTCVSSRGKDANHPFSAEEIYQGDGGPITEVGIELEEANGGQNIYDRDPFVEDE